MHFDLVHGTVKDKFPSQHGITTKVCTFLCEGTFFVYFMPLGRHMMRKCTAHKQGYSSFCPIKLLTKTDAVSTSKLLQNEYTLHADILGIVLVTDHGEANGKNVKLSLSTPRRHK